MILRHKTARTTFSWSLCLVFIVILSTSAFAQTTPAATSAQPQPTPRPTSEKNFFANILKDQKGIWTSPFHLERDDAKWIAPLGLSMAGLVATDRHTSGELVENGDNRDRLRISKDISYVTEEYVPARLEAREFLD